MNKKLITLAFILVMAVILSGTVSASDETIPDEQLTTNTAIPDPLVVETGISYTNIQAAIDSVFTEDGMTIQVEAGTYNEDVLVWKDLTIVGEDPNTTFVNSFYITSTGSGSDISGFTVTGGTGEAVTLMDAENCRIHDNNISGGYSAGIALVNSDNNISYGNTIDDLISANYYGIYLYNSEDNYFQANTISNSLYDGIWIYESDYNLLEFNIISYNGKNGINMGESMGTYMWNNNLIYENTEDGVRAYQSPGTLIIDNQIYNNHQNGLNILYSEGTDITDNQIYNNYFNGINLNGCIDTLIKNNTINDNSTDFSQYWGGISITDSNTTRIENNQIYNNYWHGIQLENGPGTIIDANQIYNNQYDGVSISNSNNVEITLNDINNNGWSGVSLFQSNNTQIQGNMLKTNENQGIYGYDCSGFNIQENEIYYNSDGIALVFCSDFQIAMNDIQENNMGFWTLLNDGIEIDESDNFTITENVIAKNPADGINIEGCNDFQVTHNNLYENNYGMEIWNTNDATLGFNQIHHNTGDGLLVVGCYDLQIAYNECNDNANGIDLIECSQILVGPVNILHHNLERGIKLLTCLDIDMDSNRIYSNINGMQLENSTGIVVQENIIYSNIDDGIYLLNSDDVDMYMNDIFYNGWGVLVDGTSDDLKLNYNRLVDNTNWDLDFICTGDMDATLNWWGYNDPADLADQIFDLGSGNLDYDPWMVLTLTAQPAVVSIGETSNITADLLYDSDGVYHNPEYRYIPHLGWANLTTTLGSITDHEFYQASATSTLTDLNSSGTATVSSTVDHQTVTTNVLVNPGASIADIIAAADLVKAFYEAHGVLPANVLVGAQMITMPQLLYLLTTATRNISLGNLNPINIIAVNPAPSPGGSYTHGNLVKAAYLTVAGNIRNFILANGRAPNYAQTSLGKIPFAKQVYMYSKVINFYGIQFRLPNYVYI